MAGTTTLQADTPKRKGNPNWVKKSDGNEIRQAQSATTTNTTSLDEVLKRIETLERENLVLKSIQDTTRLQAAKVNVEGDDRLKYRLRMIDGKIVKSWDKLLINDVRLIKGDIVENQKMRIEFIDGTTEEYILKDFTDGYILSDYYPLSSKTSLSNGENILQIELPSGEVVAINEKFVN